MNRFSVNLLTSLLLCTGLSLAHAENENANFITKQNAIELLNNELYRTGSKKKNSPTAILETALSELKQLSENGLSNLSTSIAPTQSLLSDIQCQQNCKTTEEIITDINRGFNRDAGTAIVLLPSNLERGTVIDLINDLIAPNCADTRSETCFTALSQATQLWHLVGAIRSVADQLNKQAREASRAHLDSLDKQWRSYKDDTIKLWPQEVLLSSLVHRPRDSGFSAPPNYKMLFLRPSIGLSYLSDGSPDFQPTLNVDLLGTYWWKYKDNKAQKGRGISATLIWDGDSTAYGLTYHHSPRWSMSIATSEENDLVLSVSAQLGYWLLKR